MKINDTTRNVVLEHGYAISMDYSSQFLAIRKSV
jgi:hypothetical protein